LSFAIRGAVYEVCKVLRDGFWKPFQVRRGSFCDVDASHAEKGRGLRRGPRCRSQDMTLST